MQAVERSIERVSLAHDDAPSGDTFPDASLVSRESLIAPYLKRERDNKLEAITDVRSKLELALQSNDMDMWYATFRYATMCIRNHERQKGFEAIALQYPQAELEVIDQTFSDMRGLLASVSTERAARFHAYLLQLNNDYSNFVVQIERIGANWSAVQGNPLLLLGPGSLRREINNIKLLAPHLLPTGAAVQKMDAVIARGERAVRRNELLLYESLEPVRQAMRDRTATPANFRSRVAMAVDVDCFDDAMLHLATPYVLGTHGFYDLEFKHEPEMAWHNSSIEVEPFLQILRDMNLSSFDTVKVLGCAVGQVNLLVAGLTPAVSVGIDRVPAFIENARIRQALLGFSTKRTRFELGDVREVDIGDATVYVMFNPFTGGIMDSTLERIKEIAQRRPIRIISYGFSNMRLGLETWLDLESGGFEQQNVSVFRSTIHESGR